MEENNGEGEEEVKEITTSILDVKKGVERAQVQNPNTHQNNQLKNNNNNHNNPSWFRPRDKSGRFISTSTSTSTSQL